MEEDCINQQCAERAVARRFVYVHRMSLMTIPPSDEKQGQAQAELSKMLDLQKQLRREISFARENRTVSQEALRKLADWVRSGSG